MNIIEKCADELLAAYQERAIVPSPDLVRKDIVRILRKHVKVVKTGYMLNVDTREKMTPIWIEAFHQQKLRHHASFLAESGATTRNKRLDSTKNTEVYTLQTLVLIDPGNPTADVDTNDVP